MVNRIVLNLPYDYLQSIRLVHAVMETGLQVVIRPEHDEKFIGLRPVFNVKYEVDELPALEISDISITHSEPKTRIGSIERPLIFAKGVAERCKQGWVAERPQRFAFAGLVTESRRTFFEGFMTSVYGEGDFDLKSLGKRSWLDKAVTKAKGLVGGNSSPMSRRQRVKGVTLWESTRGRSFPGKSWDQEYFDFMCSTQFILCPSGDYVWSYRFFEAALCGAIPIVEESCPAYQGFEYLRVAEARNATYNSELAERNYERCVDLITVPVEDLESEVRRLMGPPGG